MMPREPVCFTEFTDGVMRLVVEDARGQYVLGDIPREECDLPIIVEDQS